VPANSTKVLGRTICVEVDRGRAEKALELAGVDQTGIDPASIGPRPIMNLTPTAIRASND
jgi:hypothetical protein